MFAEKIENNCEILYNLFKRNQKKDERRSYRLMPANQITKINISTIHIISYIFNLDATCKNDPIN